jgi:hypothetical protein
MQLTLDTGYRALIQKRSTYSYKYKKKLNIILCFPKRLSFDMCRFNIDEYLL